MPLIDPPSPNPNNADLIVWSLYVLGGASKRIDVEDLYLKCFDIAPLRLSWRTRPDIPDYKKCAKALQEVEDSRRSNKVTLIIRLDQYNRQLSVDGVKWCEENHVLLDQLYGSYVPPAQNQEVARKAKRIFESIAFSKFNKTPNELTRGDIAIALRCTETASKQIWQSRLDEIDNAARALNRDDLAGFVASARQIIGI